MTDELHQTTVGRFKWCQINSLWEELFWCGLYAGAVLSDKPHAETWRAWISDCEDSSLVGVYLTLADAKQALMDKVWEITDVGVL